MSMQSDEISLLKASPCIEQSANAIREAALAPILPKLFLRWRYAARLLKEGGNVV